MRMFQFIKHSTGATFGEQRAAMRLDIRYRGAGGRLHLALEGHGPDDGPGGGAVGAAAKEAILAGGEDIIVLDEFTYAMHYGWVPKSTDVVETLRADGRRGCT